MDLREYVQLLRRLWFIVVAVSLGGLTIAFAISALQATEYQSTARLEVVTKRGNDVVESYASTTLAARKAYEYGRQLEGEQFARQVVDLTQTTLSPVELARQVAAETPFDSSYIELTVSSGDAGQAHEIAVALTELLVDYSLKHDAGPKAEDPDLRIVFLRSPNLPTSPAIPDTDRNLAVGGVAGLLLGVAAAIAIGRLDPRLRRIADIEAVAGRPVLAAPGTLDELRLNLEVRTKPPHVLAVLGEGAAEDVATTLGKAGNRTLLLGANSDPLPNVDVQSLDAEGYPALVSLFEQLRKDYDYVVCDAPSADAAAAADSVIVVVEEGRTTRSKLKQTVRRLEVANANVLGCIVSRAGTGS